MCPPLKGKQMKKAELLPLKFYPFTLNVQPTHLKCKVNLYFLLPPLTLTHCQHVINDVFECKFQTDGGGHNKFTYTGVEVEAKKSIRVLSKLTQQLAGVSCSISRH